MNNLESIPNSKLTLQKPELWASAVTFATKLTGYQWFPKLPSQEGVIYACGGGYSSYTPPTPRQKINKINDEIIRYENQLEREEIKRKIRQEKGEPFDETLSRGIIAEIQKLRKQIGELNRQQKQDEIAEDKREIERKEKSIEHYEIEEELHRRRGNKKEQADYRRYIEEAQEEIQRRRKRIEENAKQQSLGGLLLVPEGAMEWLLHEVGHWLAATKEERALPNYGFGIIRKGECTCVKNFTECRCGDEREWQAWAFEQIVLAPFGDARNFAPPPHRGGIAFYKNEPIPDLAYRHIEHRLLDESVDIEEWRNLWEQWIRWGTVLGRKAPWISEC